MEYTFVIEGRTLNLVWLGRSFGMGASVGV